MTHLNQRNTLVVSLAATVTLVVAITGITVGNVLNARSTERVTKHDSSALVECIESGATATDCRLLIYGSN